MACLWRKKKGLGVWKDFEPPYALQNVDDDDMVDFDMEHGEEPSLRHRYPLRLNLPSLSAQIPPPSSFKPPDDHLHSAPDSSLHASSMHTCMQPTPPICAECPAIEK
jgi:hypothetical protein